MQRRIHISNIDNLNVFLLFIDISIDIEAYKYKRFNNVVKNLITYKNCTNLGWIFAHKNAYLSVLKRLSFIAQGKLLALLKNLDVINKQSQINYYYLPTYRIYFSAF